MIIDYINGRKTGVSYGTAKYSHEISKRMPPGSLNRIEYPLLFPSRFIDGFTRRYLYPHFVRQKQKTDHIHHITNQDLAFLLNKIELPRSLVTCYDLIPWVYYKNRSPYWKRNIEGIRKADRIITISEFSKNEIIKNVGVPGDHIDIIYCGVDGNIFFPKKDRTPLNGLGIGEEQKVLLYVGSEEPRKNLGILLEAISLIKEENPNIVLLKVGSPGMGGDRTTIRQLITSLNLDNRVFFTGDVSETILAKYYNAADLFVFPSLYEGFGLPIIEAMACGCPVVASNTSSIPEVAGDAAVLLHPNDPGGFSDRIADLLIDDLLRDEYRTKGILHASHFSWDDASDMTCRLYQSMVDS
ncbi:MAG: glycosyltransferase family 1 protein [Methanolinea sp.]|jgi:glycosyltransferase involved in cell wall biosynthesis